MAIQVNAILIEGAFSPQSIPANFGNYFDGEYFYFFESEEECKLWQETHQTPLIVKTL